MTVDHTEDQRRNDLEKEVAKEERHGRRPTISSPFPSPQIQRDLNEATEEFRQRSNRDTTQYRQIDFANTNAEELKKADEEEPHPNQFLKKGVS